MQQEPHSRDSGVTGPPRYSVDAYAQSVADILPGLPILTTTRLQLELLLNDPVVDLRAVTDVILADVGATLQILRTVGREFTATDGRPDRIEDCIVSLSAARCHQVVCAPNESESETFAEEWQFRRMRAERARELARDREGFSPEEAYLVGLLHRLGTIPHLLGWNINTSTSDEDDALGVMLAFHWNLPDCVLSASSERHEDAETAKWREILESADKLTQQSIL
jgi:HD-like signal output (HDOD) protein